MTVPYDAFSPEDEQFPVSDETSVQRELHQAQIRHRFPWKILLICVVGVGLILIGLLLPVIQQRVYLNRLQAQGIVLGTTFSNTWGLQDWSVWLDDRIGFGLPLPVQIISADFRNAVVDDATLRKVTGWPDLQSASFARGTFSAENLAQFVAQSLNLRSLQVISCPHITPDDIGQLRIAHPSLIIEFRGTAMLGIRGYDSHRGCYIYHVQEYSAADRAGLMHSDLITEFAGEKITSFDELVNVIGRHEPGDEVQLKIIRRGQTQSLTCELGGWIE